MPTIGEPAPDFAGTDQDGNPLRLRDYRGQKVLLYFYPKDDTSGCTAQACDLRDHQTPLRQAGYQAIGVSVDSAASHRKFIEEYGLNFPLVADVDKTIVQQYGVWQEKSMYGKKYLGTVRTTFLVDEAGLLTDIITKVDTKQPAAQILT